MEKKLWSNYYQVLKPHCDGCLEKGINKDEYGFCSTEKEPVPIYLEDSWGRRKGLKETFDDIYRCNVYHWTIYQGQGKL